MPGSSQKNDLRQALVKYAGRILGARPYFRFKLREKLFLRAQKLNFDDPGSTIDSILSDLAKSGYLNDQYLAEAFVRSRLSKGYGPKAISLKLKFMGLDTETISQVIKSTATEEAVMTSMMHYCRKFPHPDERKMISKLYFRGYPGTLIRKVFDGDHFED